jgi:hypothetical protein
MEPTQVVTQDPMTVAAISSVVTAFLVWLSGKGWPVIKESLGWMNDREKSIRAQAQEGPIMVLERVERELKECKESLEEVLAELRDVRQKHFDCEKAHAELNAEVKHLRKQLGVPEPVKQ